MADQVAVALVAITQEERQVRPIQAVAVALAVKD
jgi:hypothetical protein